MLLEDLVSLCRSLLRQRDDSGCPPLFPDEPAGGVREPRRHLPGGRGAAIAVPEPDGDREVCVTAFGQTAQRR